MGSFFEILRVLTNRTKHVDVLEELFLVHLALEVFLFHVLCIDGKVENARYDYVKLVTGYQRNHCSDPFHDTIENGHPVVWMNRHDCMSETTTNDEKNKQVENLFQWFREPILCKSHSSVEKVHLTWYPIVGNRNKDVGNGGEYFQGTLHCHPSLLVDLFFSFSSVTLPSLCIIHISSSSSSIGDIMRIRIKKDAGIRGKRKEKERYMSFWSKQPVEVCTRERPSIGTIKKDTTKNVPTDPLDIRDPNLFFVEIEQESLEEVATFLKENYVEDDEKKFRLVYSVEFLNFFLNITDSKGGKGWKVGIRNGETGTLVGFTAAVPKLISITGKTKKKKVAEVNLLCLSRLYRKKSDLAPLLIAEITRRIRLDGIEAAVHTSGKEIHKNFFTQGRFFHALLNVPNLLDCNFLSFTKSEKWATLEEFEKSISYKDPPVEHAAEGNLTVFRPVTKDDIFDICALFKTEIAKEQYVFHEVIDELFVRQYFFESPCTTCFMVEKISKRISGATGATGDTGATIAPKREICGFVSFYTVNMMCIETEKMMNVAFVYYHCGEIHSAINKIFPYLKKTGVDMVNCVNTGNNMNIIFGTNMIKGTGLLHHYMYNYRVPFLGSNRVMYTVF
jgi:hypothetical protein